jgi:LDH2 family malate/lactate/ureidoglycolate dehydrogenase
MLEDDTVRLPGARRAANASKSDAAGLSVPAELMAKIRALAGDA